MHKKRIAHTNSRLDASGTAILGAALFLGLTAAVPHARVHTLTGTPEPVRATSYTDRARQATMSGPNPGVKKRRPQEKGAPRALTENCGRCIVPL